MRQQILGSHTPLCHRRMVITTQFSVLPCCTAAQTSSIPHQVAFDCALALAICTSGSARTYHPPTVRLVSNPRSAGLSLSLSLAFCSVGFSLSVCLAHSLSLSLCVPRPLSLSASRPLHPPKGFSLSPHPPQGVFLPSHPAHPFSLSLSPQCLCLVLPPSLLAGSFQAYRRSHGGVLSNV